MFWVPGSKKKNRHPFTLTKEVKENQRRNQTSDQMDKAENGSFAERRRLAENGRRCLPFIGTEPKPKYVNKQI